MSDNKIHTIVSSISRLTGLGVCFYDFKHMFEANYGLVDKAYRAHRCEFCFEIRNLPGGREACIKNDIVNARELARLYKRPFFNVCHIGICEYIVPIIKNDTLIGVVFIGQCRIKSEVAYDKVFQNIKKFQGDYECFEALFNKMPVTTRSAMSDAGVLTDLSFKALVNDSDFHLPEWNDNLVLLVKDYINSNYMNHITLDQISKEFHVNPSYLSRKFKQTLDINLSDYINHMRIEKAQKLLRLTTIPIAHISYNLAFSSQNYFARIFKKCTGKTPLEYRKDVSLPCPKHNY